VGYGACYSLVLGPAVTKKGASGASRAPVRQAYGGVGGPESVARPILAV